MDDLLNPETKPEDTALTPPPEEPKPEEVMEEEPMAAEAHTMQGALDYLTSLKGTYDASTTKDEVFAAIDTAIAALSEFGAVMEEAEEPEEEKKEEEKTMESRQRKTPPTGKVMLENTALKLCLAHSVSKPSAVFLESLIAVGDEAKMKALIEERQKATPAKPAYTPQKPQSTPRTVVESKHSALPKTAEEYRNYILN